MILKLKFGHFSLPELEISILLVRNALSFHQTKLLFFTIFAFAKRQCQLEGKLSKFELLKLN